VTLTGHRLDFTKVSISRCQLYCQVACYSVMAPELSAPRSRQFGRNAIDYASTLTQHVGEHRRSMKKREIMLVVRF